MLKLEGNFLQNIEIQLGKKYPILRLSSIMQQTFIHFITIKFDVFLILNIPEVSWEFFKLQKNHAESSEMYPQLID